MIIHFNFIYGTKLIPHLSEGKQQLYKMMSMDCDYIALF